MLGPISSLAPTFAAQIRLGANSRRTPSSETVYPRQRFSARQASKSRVRPANGDRRLVPPSLGNVESFGSFENLAGRKVPAGGAEGIRTPDLCSAIAALSHLSYSPARGS